MKTNPADITTAFRAISFISSRYHVSLGDLDGHCREWRVVWPRWLAMFLIKRSTPMGLRKIAYLFDRYELRTDLRKGVKLGATTYAALARLSVNLLDESRLKLEFQPVFTGADKNDDYFLGAGLTYAVTADLSWRGMFEYERSTAEKRVLTQLYYYLKVL